MRRWETLTALGAVALAMLSLVPFGGHRRPFLALCAIALIALMGYLRLRMLLTRPSAPKPTPDAYERAMRIQEMRDEKYRR
ncbi:MAG: hypothetical protein JO165_03015 [Candidatus Eremiobacteraeota bacterium]|nr:hypothetical protein [Candidatus Eremiobacteraeota bacterium]